MKLWTSLVPTIHGKDIVYIFCRFSACHRYERRTKYNSDSSPGVLCLLFSFDHAFVGFYPEFAHCGKRGLIFLRIMRDTVSKLASNSFSIGSYAAGKGTERPCSIAGSQIEPFNTETRGWITR
jgi:hypothetical protein